MRMRVIYYKVYYLGLKLAVPTKAKQTKLKGFKMTTILRVGNYSVEKSNDNDRLWLTNDSHGSSMIVLLSVGVGFCVESHLQSVVNTKMYNVLTNKTLMAEARTLSSEEFRAKYTLKGTKRKNYEN